MRRLIPLLILIIAILAVFPVYARFKASAAPIPPGVYLGDLDLSSIKSVDEIEQHLTGVYAAPITVLFNDQRIPMRAEDIDFRIDAEQMATEAASYLEGPEFMNIAFRHAIGLPQERRVIPIRYTYDKTKLRSWLKAVAEEYDSEPQTVQLLPPSQVWTHVGEPTEGIPPGYVGAYTQDWTWIDGYPGYALDITKSMSAIESAFSGRDDGQLGDTDGRVAQLVLDETPAEPATLDDLARELNQYTSDFPGFAAIYIHDLVNDEEGAVDAEVSFSGMSTLKIGIIAAIMRELQKGVSSGDEEAKLVGQWIDYALGESNNYAANQLLSYLGKGDAATGARVFTEFMRSLGFESTYMQSGYDTQVQLLQIATPGNQQEEWDTNPDSNLQSTPTEMGRILSAIYQCSQGEGILVDKYPDEITPDECSTILYYLSHDEFQEMLWAGLPDAADEWIVHKHGFAYESHSDVALVWGPLGPYVLSVFLYRSGWMDWETSNSTLKDISRITWRFFEYQQERLSVETPEAPILDPPPGYVPVKDEYIRVASNGFK